MNHYNRLTLEERYQIQALKKSELSCRKIAEQLNRSHSTILREINRNSISTGCYVSTPADNKAKKRRKNIGPECKIKGLLEDCIRDQYTKTVKIIQILIFFDLFCD